MENAKERGKKSKWRKVRDEGKRQWRKLIRKRLRVGEEENSGRRERGGREKVEGEGTAPRRRCTLYVIRWDHRTNG